MEREGERETETARERDFRDLQILPLHTEPLQISRPQPLNAHLHIPFILRINSFAFSASTLRINSLHILTNLASLVFVLIFYGRYEISLIFCLVYDFFVDGLAGAISNRKKI